MHARGKYACAVVLSLLSGCTHDTAALDNFSRAYTEFLDQEARTEASSLLPVLFDPTKGPLHKQEPGDPYYVALRAVFDEHASRETRVKQAHEALQADRRIITPMMDNFSTEIERLDQTVLRLVEAANSIRDSQTRSDAVGISRRAREIQTGFASLRELYADEFSKRRRILERVIDDGGTMRTSRMFEQDATAIEADRKRGDQGRAAVESAVSSLKDAFSALKGKVGLREFPRNWTRSGGAD